MSFYRNWVRWVHVHTHKHWPSTQRSLTTLTAVQKQTINCTMFNDNYSNVHVVEHMEQARNKVTDFDTNRNTKYQRLYSKYLIQDTIQSVPIVGKAKFVQSVTFSSKYLMIRELLCPTTKNCSKI